MSKEPTGYRTMLHDMMERLEVKDISPRPETLQLVFALALIEEMQTIAGRLEDLDAALSRIHMSLPLVGKGY